MKYHSLKLKDKILFEKFLNIRRHQLSTYAFANIFIWKELFKIFWTIIEDNLCVFFKDSLSTFLYLPPLGKKKSKNLVEKCFDIMDGFNLNKDISRIENVDEQDIDFYRSLGYDCIDKGCDYIYTSNDLLGLVGNRFKSKRAAFNYFIKHYQFDYQSYSLKDKKDCLLLYRNWMLNRKEKYDEPIYVKMLEDSFTCHKISLDNYKKLNLVSRVVKVNRQIKGYTFGFPINNDTFCILFEVTDLSIKGLSQFIFRRFVEESKSYHYINIMDDSGLENLRRVKLSYQPKKLAPAYIVKRRCNV